MCNKCNQYTRGDTLSYHTPVIRLGRYGIVYIFDSLDHCNRVIPNQTSTYLSPLNHMIYVCFQVIDISFPDLITLYLTYKPDFLIILMLYDCNFKITHISVMCYRHVLFYFIMSDVRTDHYNRTK